MQSSPSGAATSTAASRESKAHRLGLLINRKSGVGSGETVTSALNRAAVEAGADLVCVEDAGDCVESAIGCAIRAGVDRLIVAGGDGTVGAAAQALVGTPVELAILPAGTANMLARDLGVPLDLDAAIATAITGERRAIDVGEVNGHLFLIGSCLGLPTRLQRRREVERGRLKGPLLWLRMAGAALAALPRYPALRLVIESEDGVRAFRTRAVLVANNLFAEEAGSALRRPRLDAGELVLYVARDLTRFRLARLAVDVALGRTAEQSDVIVARGRCFRIGARRRMLSVMNDGERLLLRPPLVYTIRPGALKVVAPSDLA